MFTYRVIFPGPIKNAAFKPERIYMWTEKRREKNDVHHCFLYQEQVYIRQKRGYNAASIICEQNCFKYDAALNADRMADWKINLYVNTPLFPIVHVQVTNINCVLILPSKSIKQKLKQVLTKNSTYYRNSNSAYLLLFF